jgi:peptidyl-prolyl cis-trans isomerase C
MALHWERQTKMKSSWPLLALMAMTAPLAACNKDAPKGQVVATVYGDEVTERMLAAEMQAAPAGNPAAQKQAREATLERITARMVLAHAAREQKLDRSPEYAIQLKRGTEQLQATLWEKSIADMVPQPATDEVQAYIAQHPAQFADRKVYVVEQVLTMVGDPKIQAQLASQTSFDSAIALLSAAHAPMQRAMTTVDSLRIDPQSAAKLATLGPDQLVVSAANGRAQLTRVLQAQPAPVSGPAAEQIASRMVRQQRQQEAVAKAAKNLLASAKDQIKRNKAA